MHAPKIDTKCSVEVVETEKASPMTPQTAVFVVGFEEAGTNDPRVSTHIAGDICL